MASPLGGKASRDAFGEGVFWENVTGLTDKHGSNTELETILPPKKFELPLTRQQAFAIMAARWLPEEFAPEVESLP
jgi:hypothetical protein